MLYDLRNNCWDKRLLEYFDIPESMLPEIRSSNDIYGTISIMGCEIPISGMAGDQQAALFGQGCFSSGEAKTTYGTGCFLLAHTGGELVSGSNGLITTAAASERDHFPEFALEGSVFIGGAVLQWLRDGTGLLRDVKDSEYFARKTSDSGGVYMVPAFTGLGAPYWRMDAKGAILGITRGTKTEHIIRAALESIAYQTNDLVDAMVGDNRMDITEMKVDGGASANDLLMQFQSDISDINIVRPVSGEATATGAAFLAGLGVGFFKDRDELLKLCRSGKRFTPSMNSEERRKCLAGWKKAVKSVITNAEE
jgi:glycerol kinase